jgi:MFS family permease
MKQAQITDSASSQTRRPWIFFGWYIVFTGMLIQGLGYGSRYSFSVFFPTLIENFGWPRDLGASLLSSHLLCYGIVAPLAGGLVDRFGSRRTMYTGTALLSLGMILSRWGYSPWHFQLTFGLLVGVGLCLLGSVPLTVVLRNWFERRRGRALCMVFFGSGLALACYPGVAWLICHFGWRNAYTIVGLIVAVVFVPLIHFFIHYHPRDKGLTRDGLDENTDYKAIAEFESKRVVDLEWTSRDWTLNQAMKTTRFWFMCLTTFSSWGVAHHILVTHQVAFALDMGYERIFASAVLSLGGWAFCAGALISMVSDRIGREPTMTFGLGCCISSVIVLLMITDASKPWMLYYYAVVFGLGFGMCAPVVAATVTDVFQGPKVGATVGFVWFSFSMGGTIGPWLGGWLFELSGNYNLAFYIAMFFLFLAIIAVWAAAPRKVRLVPGKIATGPIA